MIKTSIELFGILILEPVTLITDVFTACVSLILFFKLNRETVKSSAKRLWILFFFLFGFSTLISGFAHGMYNYLGHISLTIGWAMGVFSVFFIENATFIGIDSKKYQNAFRIFSIIQLSVTILLIYRTQLFIPVTISSAIGMLLIILPLRIFMLAKYKDESSRKIIIAIFIAFLSAVVHTFRLSLHQWFNHKDLSHIILSISLIFFFLGARSELLSESSSKTKIKSELL